MKEKILMLVVFMLGFCYMSVIASEIDRPWDYTLTSDLNLNGMTLTVRGDFIHSGGKLNIGNGSLIIHGDYQNNSSSAKLCMNNDNGYMLVYGDFSVSSKENELSAGILEIKGDFTQSSSSSGDNFKATGTHKVKFSGNDEQVMSFQNPNESYFNTVEISNETGLMKFCELPIKNSIIGNVMSNCDINFYVDEVILKNQTIKAPNIYFYYDGNVYFDDNLVIKSNVFNINSDVYITGRTKVLGNFWAKSNYGINLSSRTSGNMYMNDADGYLLVYGDFYINSINNEFSEGVLEVKGDFTQDFGINKLSQEIHNNFAAKDNHKVVLSGTGEQIISFSNSSDSYFNDLYNYNFGGVIFATEYNSNPPEINNQLAIKSTNYSSNTKKADVTLYITENLCYSDNSLVIAIYGDGKLIDIHNLAPQEVTTHSFNNIKNTYGNCKIKVYCWSDLQDLIPLCNSTVTTIY